MPHVTGESSSTHSSLILVNKSGSSTVSHSCTFLPAKKVVGRRYDDIYNLVFWKYQIIRV